MIFRLALVDQHFGGCHSDDSSETCDRTTFLSSAIRKRFGTLNNYS